MRDLPHVLAVTTDSICRASDFPARLSALAEIGPRLGVVIRAPGASAAAYAGLMKAVSAARRLGGSGLLVHGRPDIAAAFEADGLQLRESDVSPREARGVFPAGWIGSSVHHRLEAQAAIASGADFVVAGSVFESTSHPGRPGRGTEWLGAFVDLGAPVIAIGGITPDRVPEIRDTGAWGVAAISAIWDHPDPEAAARAMIEEWERTAFDIQLTVNGEPKRVHGSTTLERLLADLDLDARAVVVELNRRIVRRPELGHTRLQSGDQVELVHFVGGG